VSRNRGALHIFLFQPPHLLVGESTDEKAPTWRSADELTYIDVAEEGGRFWRIRQDGSNRDRILRTGVALGQHDWLNDHDLILKVTSGLYRFVINEDLRERFLGAIANDPNASAPAWSADGYYIAYVSGQDIYIKNSADYSSSNPTRLIAGATDPDWHSGVDTTLPTPTPVPTSTPSDPEGRMISELESLYGVYLEDVAADGDYNYWRDPSYPERVSLRSRVQTVYDVVVHWDKNILGEPKEAGVNFRQVFGPRTVFRYTGERDSPNAAAFTVYAKRAENMIWLYNLQGAQGRTDMRCGSVANELLAGALDITRCTITHELGHVLVARAVTEVDPEKPSTDVQRHLDQYSIESVGTTPIFGNYIPCAANSAPYGANRWSPGEIWPWRDHPVGGEGTINFSQSLCNTAPFTVIREFEADMIMNFVLYFSIQIILLRHVVRAGRKHN